jgi:23S rRNA pseudouridine2605 synthase
VNNLVVKELGVKVDRNDKVTVEGKTITSEAKVYVLLNKPRGFITTLSDPQGRRTVMDLLATVGEERIYPVGRLDRDTSGLLLFTNDGELAERLSHPRNEVKKIYHVEIDRDLTQADYDKIIQNKIVLEDGQVIIDGFNLLDETRNKMGIQIHEGRNRLVRRVFEHLGYEVVKLDRTVYADLDKKDLPRGKWRFLKDKEVLRLKHFNIR